MYVVDTVLKEKLDHLLVLRLHCQADRGVRFFTCIHICSNFHKDRHTLRMIGRGEERGEVRRRRGEKGGEGGGGGEGRKEEGR